MTAIDSIRARQAASILSTTEKSQRLLRAPYVYSNTGTNDQVSSTDVVLPTGVPMHTTLRPSSSRMMRIVKVNNGTASSMTPTNLGFFQGGNSSDDDDDDDDDNNDDDDDNPRRRILGVHVASPNNTSHRSKHYQLIVLFAKSFVILTMSYNSLDIWSEYIPDCNLNLLD